MADAMVERRHCVKFFCHRCNIEFEDVLQDYICPYCASGFIEQVETEQDGTAQSADDFSDAEMSNIDDSDDVSQTASHPVLGDLVSDFLMSGTQVRRRPPRADSLLEQLMFTLGGGAGPMGAGAVTAGAPFVLVGAPGDYVFGGEGLDAVVTQLLGQLENAGPPPLSRDQIAAIPSEDVSPEHAAANSSCSVCWESFLEGEKVSRLECDHVFHTGCIEPWLRLHATCPICRRSLHAEDATGTASPAPAPAPAPPHTTSFPRVLLRRLVAGNPPQTWDSPASDSSSSATSVSTGSSVTTGGVWAPNTRSSNSTSSSSNSSTSLNSSNDRNIQFNMDIDFD